MKLSRKDRAALDRAVGVIDALTARVGAQEWQLTRSHNDNHGESLRLDVSTTAGQYRKWRRLSHQHWFRGGRWHETQQLSLAKLVSDEHTSMDKELLRQRLDGEAE